MTCPKCGSTTVETHTRSFIGCASCSDCGYLGTVPEFKAIATATITIKSPAATLRIDTCVYGIRTEYREHAWHEMTAARNKGIIKIKPTTVKLEEVK